MSFFILRLDLGLDKNRSKIRRNLTIDGLRLSFKWYRKAGLIKLALNAQTGV
ncbi:hypothetical protein [Algoriphagus hitonicola]|uniref:hypothetical protein n=1 Tax=Algoriphagus hitonicola TaxID=435880 RepID=UPI0015A61D5D|nr:hypothetical protein [Algoriphagus hitonicola]